MKSINRKYLVLVCLASLFVASSAIRNWYALDDVHVIFMNARVHSLSGFWNLFSQTYWPPEDGASLYRPLTMLAFAVQWMIGGGSPYVFHAINGVLYATTCTAFYLLLTELVSARAALVAGLLFAAHPVHVEVTANIVGQAELWVASILFLCTWHYVRRRRAGTFGVRDAVAITFGFLIACLFKENAIILPALLLAAELTLIPSPFAARVRKVAPLMVMLGVVAIVFVVVRTSVIGRFTGAGQNGVLGISGFDVRVWTALRVILEWARLLVWPAQLSSDYSFQRLDVATAFEPVMLASVALVVGLIAVAVRLRKALPAFGFGVAWIVLTLLIPSNLVVMTGFMLAERALFLASAGVIVCVAVVGQWVWRTVGESNARVRPMMLGVSALLLIAGAARSLLRAPVWHDNNTLFRQTVKDVPTSYRAHWMLAENLLEHGPNQEGLDEMLQAVVLARKDDAYVLAFAGDKFTEAGRCGIASELYRRAKAIRSDVPVAFSDASRPCFRRP
jgi:protein O-mannosyl-transferase